MKIRSLKLKSLKFLTSAVFLLGFSLLQIAQADTSAEKQAIVDVHKGQSNLRMMTNKNLKNTSMTIQGPDGLYIQNPSASNINVYVSDLKDGLYQYEYSASSDEPRKPDYKDSLNNGRNKVALKRSKIKRYQSIYQSGSIRVKNGKIVTEEEEANYDYEANEEYGDSK